MILTWYIVAMFGGLSKRRPDAIHPNPLELCPRERVQEKSDDQKSIHSFDGGDVIIYVGFAFLVS